MSHEPGTISEYMLLGQVMNAVNKCVPMGSTFGVHAWGQIFVIAASCIVTHDVQQALRQLMSQTRNTRILER